MFEADFKQLCHSNDVLRQSGLTTAKAILLQSANTLTELGCVIKIGSSLDGPKRAAILEIQQVSEPRESMVQSNLGSKFRPAILLMFISAYCLQLFFRRRTLGTTLPTAAQKHLSLYLVIFGLMFDAKYRITH